MKTVILNVAKGSAYSHLNGMTFQVKNEYVCKGKLIYALIGVSPFKDSTVDFSQDEVLLIG